MDDLFDLLLPHLTDAWSEECDDEDVRDAWAAIVDKHHGKMTYKPNKKNSIWRYMTNDELVWDMERISANGVFTTWDVVQAYPTIPWRYDEMGRNPNITWEIIDAHPDIDWCGETAWLNPNTTMEIVESHGEWADVYGDINWASIVSLPRIHMTIDEMISRLNTPGWRKGLSACPHITMDDILTRDDVDWDYSVLSGCANITWDDVMNNPDISWDYSIMSMNRNISFRTMLDTNQHVRWDWEYASANPSLRMDDVLSHPEFGWCYERLIDNRGLAGLE